MKLIVFDTETTGVDTSEDRILTCFMRATDNKKVVYEGEWVIDPGVEIPKEASDVHGMTTEWIRENGRKDVKAAIIQIVSNLEKYAGLGYVVGGYNHSFDLAILDSEVKRLGISPKMALSFPGGTNFIDPLIIDRKIDKYRKGSRKLMDVARHYGIDIEEEKLHEASYDVEVTEKLIPLVLNKAWRELAQERFDMTPEEFISWLQPKQRQWKKQWAEGVTKYFAKQGKTEEDGSPIVVEGGFPW